MSKRFLKSSSSCHEGSSLPSMSGDLPDDVLIDIFCRLPCETVFLLKCVCKRWLRIISQPQFIICFVQHKRRITRTTATKKWTFLLQMKETNSIVTYKNRKSKFPRFTLEFLPWPVVTIAATFKGLVLCYSINQLNKQREYHICNHLTKQWLSLPSSPFLPYESDKSWAALLCEEPYHYNEQGIITGLNVDYRFRVVVVHPFPRREEARNYDPFANFNLVVFCSETGQWKQVILVIPTSEEKKYYDAWSGFQGVVCNGMLYLRYNLMFGAFNPFNVTATSNGVFAAASLPLTSLTFFGTRSHSIYSVSGERMLCLSAFESRMLLIAEFKHESKGLPLRWEFAGVRKLRLSHAPPGHYLRVLGVHPMDKKLVYLIATHNNRVFLCDVRSQCVKPLNLWVPSCHLSAFTLELQCWPTLIPRIVSSK